MQIISGMAGNGSVMLTSTEFKVAATVGADGGISCTLRKHNALLRFLLRHKYLCPKVAVSSLRVLSGLTTKQILLLVGFLIFSATTMQAFAQNAGGDPHANMAAIDHWMRMARPLILLPVPVFFYRYMRGYYAAAHMAMAAYERHGVAGLHRIAEQSRVYRKCSMRFVPPMVAVSLIVMPIQQVLGEMALILSFLAFEAVLWMDTVIGLDKIRVTARASELFQRHLATKPPNEQELGVAREALRKLLIAHGEV